MSSAPIFWAAYAEFLRHPLPAGERRRAQAGELKGEVYHSMEAVRFALILPEGKRLFLGDEDAAREIERIREAHGLSTEVRTPPSPGGEGDLILNREGSYVCRLKPDRLFLVPDRAGEGLFGELVALYETGMRPPFISSPAPASPRPPSGRSAP